MPEQDGCELLGDDFGIIVQVVLAVLAFSSLYYKWSRERPRRKARIWLFDISKQACGACLQHFYNILYSVILSDSLSGPASECQWYFLNILVDTTIGVLLMYIFLQIVKYWARKRNIDNLVNIGDYGDSTVSTQPHIFKRFIQQLIVWLLIVISAKIVLSAVTFGTAKWLQDFTALFFWPLYDYPRIELVIVMICVPLILNILQFWVCDNFLKKKKELVPVEGYDMNGVTDTYGREESDEEYEESEEEDEEDEEESLLP